MRHLENRHGPGDQRRELERHLKDIAQLGVEWIVFSGGEPLMHSDLFRLADLVRSCGIRTTMLTTGLPLARHAKRVARSMDDVVVSLDGSASVHDAIRRVPGAFDLVAAGVRAIQALRPDYPVSARSTLQRGNALRLRETVSAAREIGLKSISFLATNVKSGAFHRLEDRPALAPARDQLPALEGETKAHRTRVRSRIRRRGCRRVTHPGFPPSSKPAVRYVLCFFHDPIGGCGRGPGGSDQ